MINRVMFIGKLVSISETKHIKENMDVCRVVLEQANKDKTIQLQCDAWNNVIQEVSKFGIGSWLGIEGKLTIRQATNKTSGETMSFIGVTINNAFSLIEEQEPSRESLKSRLDHIVNPVPRDRGDERSMKKAFDELPF